MDNNKTSKKDFPVDSTVSFRNPFSDLLYGRFRKELFVTDKLLKGNPDADLNVSGTIILSNKIDDNNYMIQTTSFGGYDDIINTLTISMLNEFKATAPTSSVEERKDAYNSLVECFFSLAINRLFDDDTEPIINKSLNVDELYYMFRTNLIKAYNEPNKQSNKSGIILLSEKQKEPDSPTEFHMNHVVFGNTDDVIMSLMVVIIEKLKSNIKSEDPEAKGKILTSYMNFLIPSANEDLLDYTE